MRRGAKRSTWRLEESETRCIEIYKEYFLITFLTPPSLRRCILLLSFLAATSAAQPGLAEVTLSAPAAASLPDAPMPASPKDGLRTRGDFGESTVEARSEPTGPQSTNSVQANAPEASAKQQTPPAKASDYDLKRAEHQRILGLMPEFQAVNNGKALEPLRPREKFHLMWKSSTDPFIFTLASIVSGIGQAKDSNPGYHQGLKGYAKRFGASYADTLDGNFWGNAVLTVAFKEDPRYYRKGESFSYLHRALYSAGTALWTRKDNGKWGPNYANVLGNLISGGISNAYYPADDRGVGKTFSGAATVTAEGTIGSELIEFWPDIARKLFPKHYRERMGIQAGGTAGE